MVEPGFVSLRLCYEGSVLACSLNFFEYRDSPLRTFKRERDTTDPFYAKENRINSFDSEHSQLHKVRLIERVTYINQQVSSFGTCNETSFFRDYFESADNRFDEETERLQLVNIV